MFKLISVLLFLVFCTSCGQAAKSIWPETEQVEAYSEPAITETYTYAFNGISCTTNSHSASSFEEICTQLKDSISNEDCAEDKREELFISAECPGEFY